jgi:prepilin-type N-terminal cleavage/methylation domain-containing protein
MTPGSPTRRPRAGFTIGEVLVALAVLAAAATLSAEALTRTAAERSRLDARLEAVDAAANALEAARARPWDDLTPEWAAAQAAPASLARWPDSKLTVRVEPEPDRPRVKRVTAEVSWERKGLAPWPTVALTTLVAARSAGGKP